MVVVRLYVHLLCIYRTDPNSWNVYWNLSRKLSLSCFVHSFKLKIRYIFFSFVVRFKPVYWRNCPNVYRCWLSSPFKTYNELSQFGAANDNHWKFTVVAWERSKNITVFAKQFWSVLKRIEETMKESFFNWGDHSCTAHMHKMSRFWFNIFFSSF